MHLLRTLLKFQQTLSPVLASFYKISTKAGTRHLTRGVFVSLYAELEAINKNGETALHRACSFKEGVFSLFRDQGVAALATWIQ